MKKQGTRTPQEPHNSTTKVKDTKITEMLEKEFKNLLFKMINDLKEDSNS
jgi:phage-related tail protein